MLLSKPEPEPLPAPPFCGMQVTPALRKDLYSEPSSQPRGLQTKNQRRPSPATHGAELGPQVVWAQTKATSAFMSFVPFPTEIGPGGTNPECLCWSEQEIPVSSRESLAGGQISSHRFPPTLRDTESCQSLTLALGEQCLCHHALCASPAKATVRLSYPKLMLGFLTLSQVTGRSETINN